MIERRTPVTILRAALVEGYGGAQVRNWDLAVGRTVFAHVQPSAFVFGSSEVVDRRQISTSVYALDLPAGTDIEATDRVVFDGRVWEVDGEPRRWSMQGTPHHVEVSARRVEEPAS